ncbi:MAG: hypothetical protein HYS07_00305 [Chlamydiae bacterium]|nr:hypothetical protein [Chlamydiota bacterium]MBI3276349.1 hypothetical protein [Chlamydiota bacterium]
MDRINKISVKIGIHKDWLIAEATHVSSHGFRCLLEQALPLESQLEIVMMIPSISKSNRISRKARFHGIVKMVECISGKENEVRYDTEIVFDLKDTGTEKLIAQFGENVHPTRTPKNHPEKH